MNFQTPHGSEPVRNCHSSSPGDVSKTPRCLKGHGNAAPGAATAPHGAGLSPTPLRDNAARRTPALLSSIQSAIEDFFKKMNTSILNIFVLGNSFFFS